MPELRLLKVKVRSYKCQLLPKDSVKHKKMTENLES